MVSAKNGKTKRWILLQVQSDLTQAACVKEADKECTFKELERTVVAVEGGPSQLILAHQKELPRLEIELRCGTQDWTTRPLSLEAPLKSEFSQLPAIFWVKSNFPNLFPSPKGNGHHIQVTWTE